MNPKLTKPTEKNTEISTICLILQLVLIKGYFGRGCGLWVLNQTLNHGPIKSDPPRQHLLNSAIIPQ